MKKIFALLTLTAMGLTACQCNNIPKEINGDQVFFAFDSAAISNEMEQELLSQSLYLKKHPDTTIVMEGRCDERGSTDYNLALGALRAGNAAHVLIKDGIETDRIKTISYGKEKPLYTGTGESVWQKNRNVTTRVVE